MKTYIEINKINTLKIEHIIQDYLFVLLDALQNNSGTQTIHIEVF